MIQVAIHMHSILKANQGVFLPASVLKASPARSRIDGCHSRSPMRADESTKGQRMWSAAPRNFVGKNPHSMQSKLG